MSKKTVAMIVAAIVAALVAITPVASEILQVVCANVPAASPDAAIP